MAKPIEVHVLLEGLPGEQKLVVGVFATYQLAQQMEATLKAATPALETTIDSTTIVTSLPAGV